MPSHSTYKAIGEHHVLQPQIPSEKRDIFFHEEKKENQFWRRDKIITQYRQIWFDFIPNYTKMWQNATWYNGDGLLETLNHEDSEYVDKIFLQERDRRINGVWFFNNGEPTWITGDHYFLLMYARMQRHDGEGSFADYREFQGDYFKLLHHCKISPNILGLFISKPKKTGVTNIHWSGYYLNKSTLYKNRNLGYMNIILQQAAKTFNDYFMYSYNGLISPLKPSYKNKSEVEGTIIFGATHTSSKKIRRPNSEDNELNTSIFCVPTKPKAFDVAVMSDITFDEPTKYKESFGEIWRTNKEAVKIQSKINGKAWLFNYTPDEDSQSFKEARDVFFESELKTITEFSQGQTKSQLICHHIPAYAAWEGAFDKYGICDEKRAVKEIEFERSRVKSNPRALQAITRQYANNKKEAWRSAGAGSVFDNVRLGDILTDIEEEERSAVETPYLQGKLEWKNKKWELGLKNKRPKGDFCEVEFIPITEQELMEGETGRLRIYEDIPHSLKNAALKRGRDEWGNLIPPDIFKYVLGADPVSHAAASEVIEGSTNSYHVMDRQDDRLDALYGKVSTRTLKMEYFFRPELPDEAYEDLLKLIIYTGSLSAVEGNVPEYSTRLLGEGLGLFMLVKNADGVITIWERWMGLINEPDKQYHLLRTTGNGQDTRDRLEMFVRMMKSYIQKPPPGGKDYGKTLKSARLVNQLMNVDVTDTKFFDMFMSWGYCLLADEIYSNILLNDQSDHFSGTSFSSVMAAFER